MKQPWKAFTLLVVSAVATVGFSSEYFPGEVLVKYKTNVARSQSVMRSLYQNLGVQNVKMVSRRSRGLERLTLQSNMSVDDVVARLNKLPYVEYAQPNYVLRIPTPVLKAQNGAMPCIPGFDMPDCDPDLCLIPGIPFPPGCRDWGDEPGEPGDPSDPGDGGRRPPVADRPAEVDPPVADPELSKLWGMSKAGAVDTWQSWTGDPNFVVAVIDTGIDYNHEDLAFNVWRNPNPTNDDVTGYDFVHGDGLPFDDQGHGTHVSGTIGAVGGNGTSIVGMNHRVSIMALKFLTKDGSGSVEGAIQAIDYAIEHGARVLNNSWGGRMPADRALSDAIERAREAGVLFVAAAGNDSADNDGAQRSYPAAYEHDNILAVAATDEDDKMAYFSNYGKKSTDIGAPGVNIYSSVPGNKYASYSGTSMACPHVVGAAALIWSAQPNLTYDQVKEVLMETSDPVESLEGKTVTGARLNVLNALQRIAN